MSYFSLSEINFSPEAQQEILRNVGYVVETVTSYYTVSAYHNTVERYDCKITIAYKERPSEDTLKRDKYVIEHTCGLKTVFHNYIQSRILTLLLHDVKRTCEESSV